MIKSIKKSILLPGSFFEEKWQTKIDLIASEKKFSTIYFYDHDVNPVDKNCPMYDQFDAINIVQDHNANLRLGTLITNITRHSSDKICTSLNNFLLMNKDFDLGIGIGDEMYEVQSKKNKRAIEATIDTILSSFVFDKNDLSIFIGGSSDYVRDLAIKYDLGLNLWNRNPKYIKKVFKELGKKDNGRNSFTVHQDSIHTVATADPYCEEVIFVVKDSSFDEFITQLDSIKGWKKN